MFRIGICDDEQEARFALRCAVERLLERADIPSVLYEFSSAEGFLTWLSRHPNELDLVFLDIEMPDMSGMEAAGKIREKDAHLPLVFVTGYADYVFDGYTVGALDYLTKPLALPRLESVLRRVQALLYQREPETYTIQNKDGLFRVPLSHILYFMSDRRQVTLVTRARTLSFYAKLDDVERQLGGDFVRLHRRYLANVGAVDSMEGDTVHIGPEDLPVSRGQKPAVLRAIADSMFSKEGSLGRNTVDRPV